MKIYIGNYVFIFRNINLLLARLHIVYGASIVLFLASVVVCRRRMSSIVVCNTGAYAT